MNAPTRPMRGSTIAEDEYQNRLRRIEGQVRGLQRMVDEEIYCPDVLTQIALVTKALQSVVLGLLDQQVRHCVANAQGRDGTEPGDYLVDEAMAAFARLLET